MQQYTEKSLVSRDKKRLYLLYVSSVKGRQEICHSDTLYFLLAENALYPSNAHTHESKQIKISK